MKKSGINLENVKYRNKSAILKLIHNEGAMSRKDIANSIGLTPAAVTMLCNEMIADNIIFEKGEMQEEKRVGRRKVLVDINYNYKCVMAISIEYKFTYITICDLKGNVIKSKRINTNKEIPPKSFLKELSQECKVMLWENEKPQSELLGIGICITGIVNRTNGISIHAYGIWDEVVDIKKHMEEYMQCPVIVENNVKAFAEGELIYGIGKKGKNILFIKWGPGVGSAVVIENEIYEGYRHNAAEIGHYIIEPNGISCRCGRKGCLETRVSIKAIRDRVIDVYSEKVTPKLYSLTNGNKNNLTEEMISYWIENFGSDFESSNETIRYVFDGIIERLARAVVNAITMFAPEHTILFGTLLENDEIRKIFMKYCQHYDEKYTDDYINKSKLSKKISYIGPTALVTKALFFETGGSSL